MQVHPAACEPDRLLADCETRRQRRSGPGGQHRNKVETAVILVHRPTGVRGEATERRSQHENHRQALHRLRVNLALQVRQTTTDLPPAPSDAWRRHCQAGRVAINPRHADFPSLLSEALDVLQAQAMDPAAAADWLGCTRSQLVRFLKLEPRALAQLNQARRSQGLRPLR
jgi:hypothetical protein